LEDENIEVEPNTFWTPQDVKDLIGVTSGHIRVGTVRNMNVPVAIEIYDESPNEQYLRSLHNDADHVVECSIEVKSGKGVIAGNSDYYPDALRIPLTANTYAVNIYYNDLDTLRDNGLNGDDNYMIVMYPAGEIPTRVVKRAVIS
jgi:hypothetical protein